MNGNYGFIESCFDSEIKSDSFSELIEGWLNFIDVLALILIVRQNTTKSWQAGRVGVRVKKEDLIGSLTAKVPEDKIPSERLLKQYEALMAAGSDYASRSERLSLLVLIFDSVFTPVERLMLFAAFAPEYNRKYEELFSELSGDASRGQVTVGVILDMYSLVWDDREAATNIISDENSFLNRFLLRKSEASKGRLLSKPLELNSFAVKAILGSQDDYASMQEFASVIPKANEEESIIARDEYDKVKRVLQGKLQCVAVLLGKEGVGRKYILSRLMEELHLLCVCVRLDILMTYDNRRIMEILDELSYKHFMYGDLVYIEASDMSRFSEDRLQFVFSRLQSVMNKLIVGADKLPPLLYFKGEEITISFHAMQKGAQKTLWKEIAKREGVSFGEDVSLDVLVSKYDLLPGKISSILKMVGTLTKKESGAGVSDEEGGEAGAGVSMRELEDRINDLSNVRFGRLAAEINNGFTMKDIFLTDLVKKQVEKVLNRVRYSTIVNDTYGFGRNLPYGHGTSVVLYGPPGTGKTMLASVIANELNQKLFRIDLSQIGSKYVGETEKNLGELFEAARGSNCILFFDEADALFAKRTKVSGSNDRYANTETAYLLQQIEDYGGLSILATNAMQNFDAAFKRRMTFMIPVEAPNAEERLELWNHIFPEDVPLSRDINYKMLADCAEITGSSIKAAALDAAYSAAARGTEVNMNDLIDSVDIQCKRNGIIGIGQTMRFGK